MLKRVLITRPQPEAATFAAKLEALGASPLIAPLLTIEPGPFTPDALATLLDMRPQAVLATSRHAFRAAAPHEALRTLPWITVGEATAALARTLGFSTVTCGGEHVEALMTHLTTHLAPTRGPLLYLSGTVTRVDLQQVLQNRHFTVHQAIAYQTKQTPAFAPETLSLLRAGDDCLATFFSLQTAEHFLQLCRHHQVLTSLPRYDALCLSPAIAASLAQTPWRSVQVADSPTEAAMCKAVQQWIIAHETHEHT